MAIEINTKVTVGPIDRGKKLGNLTLEDAKFFGRPNFSGEEDRFKDSRRKFTVLVPNAAADELRALGWNVKTNVPTAEEKAQYPDREEISHLKVMVDDSSTVVIRVGADNETLNPNTFGVIDRSRIQTMDMEIRAWEYDPDERPNQFSARLVLMFATIQMSALEQKYHKMRETPPE